MIKQEYLIAAPIDKVWEALVDPNIIESWGAGPAVMNDQVGSKFKLWDGDIHGTNTGVVKNKILMQDWYGGDWKEPSKVVFELSEVEGKTKVVLTHSNVPEDEVKDFDEGWKSHYMGPLKEYLES